MASSAEDAPTSSRAAENLLKRLEERYREPAPQALDPESHQPPEIDTAQAPSHNRPPVPLSAKQRRCAHPASMVKRFDDGLTYCRLCYACLTP